MNVLLIVVAAGWGAGAGWLLARPGYRLAVEPGEPWRTDCPAGHPLGGSGGGLLGAARCGRCEGRGRYGRPEATALGTASLCAALAAATGPRPELVVWLLLAPLTVLLCLVDLAVRRLPDALTFALAGAAAALLGLAALAPHHAGSWSTALLGGLALGGGYGVLFLINPAGLGFGDVKLALGLGVMLGWYGWPCLFSGALLGLVLGALYGLGLLLLRRADRKAAFPLGPFLIAGAFGGLLLGAAAA
ncbi:A24 family peptidase; A24 family peptidase; prepilin peptidase [Streptomyces sp. NBC_00083]|uniref:prepilin peptidase n=1 Tax=Streptomyces sp. NBC_00083 TaxID=2975647 RepID=UPI00225710DE|nr:A24 family peptidase [Streptomyces sp. NBC_00083]MCX5384947.1 A24 family peptidase [Streptomyces sp. NBC_00083]